MAAFGNNMWGTGELNPSNFAGNGTHNQAVAANNKRANPPISDSFIGAPLAMGSDSPPAGPIEESLRGSGGYETLRVANGWKGLPVEGKIFMPVVAGALGLATASFTGNALMGVAGTVVSFILADGWLRRR
jgi:hypothetical protein